MDLATSTMAGAQCDTGRLAMRHQLCSSIKLQSAFTSTGHVSSLARTRVLRQRQSVAASAARRVVAAAASTEKLPSLNDLPIFSYINGQGRIIPPLEPGTVASVFAVLDKNKKVQYVGFSKDIRNTLRTLMGRRPEFCYFYKLINLQTLDQQRMLDIRGHWFSEIGLAPVGNTDLIQRGMWEKPADAGSISERGKAAAAQSKAKTLMQMMQDRGVNEEMVYDPVLLDQGKCDILPSKELSKEELAEAAVAAAANASKQMDVKELAPNGEEVEFEIRFDNKIKTNGGWMYDIFITKDDKETMHRVVCGKIYPDAVSMHEDDFVARTFAFLLHKKLPRHTEGLLSMDQFGVNYFAISEVAQKFNDFQSWFQGELPDSYWRFNRIHEYGNVTAPGGNDLPPVRQTALAPEIYTPQY